MVRPKATKLTNGVTQRVLYLRYHFRPQSVNVYVNFSFIQEAVLRHFEEQVSYSSKTGSSETFSGLSVPLKRLYLLQFQHCQHQQLRQIVIIKPPLALFLRSNSTTIAKFGEHYEPTAWPIVWPTAERPAVGADVIVTDCVAGAAIAVKAVV